MDKLHLQKIVIGDQVTEDPNENKDENESVKSSKDEYRKDSGSNSYVVDVKMNQENNSNIDVKININANTSKSTVNKEDSKSVSAEKDEEEKSATDKSKTSKEKEISQFNDSRSKSDEEEGSDKESEEEKDHESVQFSELKQSNYESIEDYYKELREHHGPNNQWEDPDFGADRNLFSKPGEVGDNIKEDLSITFDRICIDDEKAPFFCFENSSHNINYEFKIKRGIINDRFFLGAFLMLFRRREEYFQNLILDYSHIKENLNAGFCGFTFFINGEWKNITIDTRIPKHQDDEITISNTETQNAYWMCLFEKAYAKAFKTYDVLNGLVVNDFLVDLTGGWARSTQFTNNKETGMDEPRKKALFEEIVKALGQKYLIGCMKYDDTKLEEDFDSDKSDDGAEDEAIAPNCMHNILDAQEDNGVRLIYLVNYWPKGKWTGSYSVEDETWEANKALAERLNYQVSQSDGTFWMSFDDWVSHFNRIYYCRIFPETWSQFCIEGKWTAMTSGGAPPKKLPWYPEKFHVPEKQGYGYGASASTVKQSASQYASPSPLVSNKRKTGLAMSTQNFIKQTPLMKSNLGYIEEERGGLMKSGAIGSVKGTMRQSKLMPSTVKKSILISTPMTNKDLLGRSSLGQTRKTITSNSNNPNAESVIDPSQLKSKAAPKKKAVIVKKEVFKRNIIVDTEDRWFLNPQYKIEIGPGCKMIISLMQEDKKLQEDAYLKCSFLIIYCKGKYSRVWDVKDTNIVKIAENKEDKNNREIIIQLEYFDVLKKINDNKKKKLVRGEGIQLNLIPFIDYSTKYEVDKPSKNMITFKPYAVETVFWLRVFASTPIYIAELPKPYECTIQSQWTMDKCLTAGGARYITEESRTFENPKWAINPQYLITFEKNVQMKIVVRKTTGRFSNEENRIGFILCKPDKNEEEGINLKQRTATSSFGRTMSLGLKTEQIFRVMESTARILDNKKNKLDEIYPKLLFNSSEWVVESSYGNPYCACLYMTFNRIDSPIVIIPTLDSPDTPFEFEIKIFSNRSTSMYCLNNNNCEILKGEWKETNCGGCHLTQDEKKKKIKEDVRGIGMAKQEVTWYDNPKFNISFDAKEKIPVVEFEVVLTRSESIWRPIIAKGVINSMIGVYLFEYHQAKWKEKCINLDTIDFMPKNEITLKFEFENVDPRGFIIMPVTYGSGVKGPFLIMVKCKTPFSLTRLEDKFN